VGSLKAALERLIKSFKNDANYQRTNQQAILPRELRSVPAAKSTFASNKK
jgi:hypothetical protein